MAAKQALLVANADYSHFGKLPNPISDARQLADVLQQIGFNVNVVENASREGMLDALSSFEARLKATRGIAFFHYGGHGVQVDGKNFLIPADADIPHGKRVATRAVDVDEVMGALDASGSSANVVVLDACRDNPLPAISSRSATRGLSVVAHKPNNTIVIYAAEAGSKAEDGLFTPTLAQALAVPGRAISDVMTDVRRAVFEKSGGAQTPGEYNQLFDRFVLNDASGDIGIIETYARNVPSTTSTKLQQKIRSSTAPGTRPVPNPFLNSLGHRLVQIPGTEAMFSIWPVRVADYQAFVSQTGRSWKAAGVPQKQDHPAVRISYHDAQAFCRWLTEKELLTGELPPSYEYRLTTDLEWSAAVGIVETTAGPPAWRSGAIPDCFPWGSSWPPPPGSGNYDGRLRADSFSYTSPVGSFAPNRFGLYDISGNVFEWVFDDFDESGLGCLRGGSWPDESPVNLNLSIRCQDNKTTAHKCYGFRFVLAPIGSGVR